MLTVRWIVIFLLLAVTMSLTAAERQLAGIRLGMKPNEVIDKLGEPNALILAQPPLEPSPMELAGGGGMGAMMTPGMSEEVTEPVKKENTLIFLYRDNETVLTPPRVAAQWGDTGSSVPGGAGASSTPGGPQLVPYSAAGGGSQQGVDSPEAQEKELPLWSYLVRVARLGLDQQQMIYQFNDTYYLGVTITGVGVEARVTDIVACSYEPFSWNPKTSQVGISRKKINFAATMLPKDKRKVYPAGTTRGVLIGSRLEEVLRAHKWPDAFIPFDARMINMIKIPTDKQLRSLRAPLPATPAVFTNATKGVGFTNYAGMILNSDFSDNYLLLYPSDNVAFTLVNGTVVRIQIGTGVARPQGKFYPPGTTPEVTPGM